jgi:hypothetical protein
MTTHSARTFTKASPDTPFLLSVLTGLVASAIITGGIAVTLAVRILSEPSIQLALTN